MTIDVNVKQLDEAFLDEIDEIMEDTMVQLFVVHPDTPEEIAFVQSQAVEHNSIFYTVPYAYKELEEEKCLGYTIKSSDTLDVRLIQDKVLFMDESEIDDKNSVKIQEASLKGVILNPTHPHTEFEHFLLSFGLNNVDHFDKEELNKLSMDKIVLQSSYPEHDFSTLLDTAKKISDVMFRPEHSIIARATKNALALFGLR